MKKKTSIIIGVIVVIIMAIIGEGVAVSGVLDPYEKQIKLGYKMINEERYEEAILAFNTAIDIDQKREKAYVGLADTYVSRCDESTVDDASDALRRGYEQSQSEKIVEGYINSAQTLYDKDKKDWAVKLLQYGYESTNSNKLKSKINELIKLLSAGLLEKIYNLCENNEVEQISKIMNTEDFINIASLATSDTPIIYSTNITSKKIGIYYVEDKYNIDSYYSKYFIYFGEYNNDVRNGNGIWINTYEDDIQNTTYYLYNGEWKQDKPNGNGMVKEYDNGSEWTMSGMVVDGAWNGEIQHQCIINNEIEDTMIWSFDKGIANVIFTDKRSGENMVAKAVDGNDEYHAYTNEELQFVHGVLGFTKIDYMKSIYGYSNGHTFE